MIAASKMRKRPRVLLAGNFLSRLGLARAPIEDLSERLGACGYEVIAVSPYRNRILRPAHMLATAVLRSRRYDAALVDVYSGPAFRIAETVGAALKMVRRPYVACLHGGGLPEFAAASPARVTAFLSGAAAVTAPSSYLAEGMKSYCESVTELPNALDLGAYSYRLRRETAPRLVWLRSLRNIYNPLLAIEVLARVRQRRPDARLTMVGADWGDGTRAKLEAAIKSLSLGDAVELRGAVAKSAVSAALNEGDIFLNTTDFDNTPVSVLEAMACGLCVVSTNVGGLPRLISHERDGLLVKPRDAEAMSTAVFRVLDSPQLAHAISAGGRRKAEACGWERLLPRWLELIDQVASGGGVGRQFAAANYGRGATS